MECRDCGAALPAEARFCLQCGSRVPAQQDTAADPLRDALERAIGFQYRIERLIGRGGMGAVYLAHELALDRDVAIKVLPPEHAGTTEMRARFRHEARTAARLTHPNIVPLHTFGEVDGLMYFVMGYVPGESLSSRLTREGAMPADVARMVFADLAGALEYAHSRGVVHRDVKPDNILIDGNSGAPLLTDFGIAKATLSDGQLTTTGQIVGTAYYMSPEQALGRPDVDARSDLYSLGVVMYEIVSGRRPFNAESPVEALTQRLRQDPQPLRAAAPYVDDDLARAIMRCLQREPGDRWPDAKSLRAALASGDDDTEDPVAVGFLRVASVFALVGLIAAGYLALFVSRVAAMGLLLSAAFSSFIFGAGATVVLKHQGLDMRSILHTALRQPRWWRFWYPKRFRRVADVWDRLPLRIRWLRIQAALTFCLIVGIGVPVQIGMKLTGGPRQIIIALTGVMIALVLLLLLQRSGTTKYVATTLGVPPVEASKILSTASWRTSVWQRGPACVLLRPSPMRPSATRPSPARGTPAPASDVAPTLAQSRDDSGDAATRS